MMQTEEKVMSKAACYHCGDPVFNDNIVEEDKHFCCDGCKTVYQVLSENNLCDYYQLEKNPGISTKDRLPSYFDYLDKPEIAKSLLDFTDEHISRVTFYIPSIHCSSCIWLLEHLSVLHNGVMLSQTNFTQKQLVVQFGNGRISLRELVELLDRIGYTPVINLEENEAKKSKNFDKSLLIKMGVSGFCFGNIMLLSFPDYLGISTLENEYQTFFRWLNVVLSLPVVFYSGLDYFTSAFKSLTQRFANIDVPIALGISALFLRSTYEVLSGIGPGYFDSLVGLVFFLLIGKWFQNRTYESLSFERDYKSYFPLAALVNRKGKIQPENVKQIVKGDELVIRNGELVPADAILIDDEAYLDFSFVTGESETVRKVKGDYIYAGGRLEGKQGRFIAQKEVSQSHLTALWNNEAFHEEKKSVQIVDRISQYFTVAIVLIALGSALFWQFTDAGKTWMVFTSVLIIACPCALALSSPFTFGSVLRIFGREKFFLKGSSVIERLRKVDTIVFDKTGTLTSNEASSVIFNGELLTEAERSMIWTAVSSSLHPISRNIKEYLGNPGESPYALEEFSEINGQGILARVSGVDIQIGSAQFIGETKINSTTGAYLVVSGKLRGRFEVRRKFRVGVDSIVSGLDDNYDLHVLSGDNASDREMLESLFSSGTEMHFNQSPHDKLNYIQKLQEQGKRVLMLGDGLNDAGALKQSDVGIAVTDDTSNFSPACDAILDANSIKKFVKFLGLTKASGRVIWYSFALSILYNLSGLVFAVSGLLTPLIAAILMPLSSISVVVFTTMSIRFLAYKLKF